VSEAGEGNGRGPGESPCQGLSLLVVEDEGVTAFLLEGVLAAMGHRILGAVGSADEAVRLARQRRPDLALVDVQLRRGRNGIELARELKRDGVPVLFLTAHPDLARQQTELALGWIEKPYSPTMVAQSVQAVCETMRGNPPEHLPFGLHLFDRMQA
jgi:DNA-binding response OmpR family regulator